MVTLVQHAAEIRAFLESHFDTHGFISFSVDESGALVPFVLRRSSRVPDATRTNRFVGIVMAHVVHGCHTMYLNVYEDQMLLSTRGAEGAPLVDKWVKF
jgi:hypothetical protein